MTFPTVAATDNTGGSDVDSTTHPVSLAGLGTIQPNDLLVVVIVVDAPTNTWPVIAFPAGQGWTAMASNFTTSGAGLAIEVAYKHCTGTETNFNVTTTLSESSAVIAILIRNNWMRVAPEINSAGSTFATSAAPNAPVMDPAGWAIEDTLWLTFVGWDNGTTDMTAPPSNFSNMVKAVRDTSANGVGVAFASRQERISSVDPAAWTLSASQAWIIRSLMVRPIVTDIIQPTAEIPFPGMPEVTPALGYFGAPAPLTITQPVAEISTGDTIVAYGEADIVAQFVLQELPTTRTVLYTVPVGRAAVIRWADFVNLTASPTTIDIWFGGFKWESHSVGGNDHYSRNTIVELAAGQQIEGQASMAGMTAFISGVLEQAP